MPTKISFGHRKHSRATEESQVRNPSHLPRLKGGWAGRGKESSSITLHLQLRGDISWKYWKENIFKIQSLPLINKKAQEGRGLPQSSSDTDQSCFNTLSEKLLMAGPSFMLVSYNTQRCPRCGTMSPLLSFVWLTYVSPPAGKRLPGGRGRWCLQNSKIVPFHAEKPLAALVWTEFPTRCVKLTLTL